jgi:hypothetical protein
MAPAYWQISFAPRHVCQSWQESGGGNISAMSGFVTFLIILAVLVVVLEYTRRRHDLYAGSAGSGGTVDRDRERLIAELRAADHE